MIIMAVDNNSSISKLVNDLVIYHSDLGLAICQPCKVGFLLDPEPHLLKYHKTLRRSERQEIACHIQSLPGRRSIDEINADLSIRIEREAIYGLDIIEAWKCNQCWALGAKTTIQRHCRDHNQIEGQRTNPSCISANN